MFIRIIIKNRYRFDTFRLKRKPDRHTSIRPTIYGRTESKAPEGKKQLPKGTYSYISGAALQKVSNLSRLSVRATIAPDRFSGQQRVRAESGMRHPAR